MSWILITCIALASTVVCALGTIIIGIKKIDNMYKELEELKDLDNEE